MDGDEPARLDVDALRRVLEQQRQRAAERHEDLLLVRVDVPAAARVRRDTATCARATGQLRGVGDRRLAARRLARAWRLALLPLQVGGVDDVEGHRPRRYPPRAMARPTYPRAGEPRPAALPPAERTVGQLVAESIRIYGEHFAALPRSASRRPCSRSSSAHVSQALVLVLAPTLDGALLSASFVGACVLVLERRPSDRAARASPGSSAGSSSSPVPFLVLAFILPGARVARRASGSSCRCSWSRSSAPRAAFARAWRLARADYVHALGSLATLAIVVLLTQGVLAFILRGAGGAGARRPPFVLANVVISPLLFIGAALLYVDQAARGSSRFPPCRSTSCSRGSRSRAWRR